MKENDHHFFAYISRMRFINRWALMRNSYTENIQEHSHMTAVLAHALAVIRNQFFDGRVDEGQVAVAALYHDAGEILTGDMPTPIKYYNPAIREAYRQVERVAEEKLLAMLPDELRPTYSAALSPAALEIQQLVHDGKIDRTLLERRDERSRNALKYGLFQRIAPFGFISL